MTANRVLALDLARTTGWAVGAHGADRPEAYGEFVLPTGERGQMFTALRARLRRMIRLSGIDTVIYEQPWSRGAGSFMLTGYGTIAEQIAWEMKCACLSLSNQTVKAHFGSKGKPTAQVRALLGDPDIGEDAADACALWWAAMARMEWE